MARRAARNGYNFIDLFAGAGGLSEGFIQAGFTPVAHVEMNPYAVKTLETRTAYYWFESHGRLNRYYEYLKGNLSRAELLSEVPDECLNSVICETMSVKTLPGLFGKIDGLLEKTKDRGTVLLS